MIRAGRRAKYPAVTGDGGTDTETLQTDVMRFMAILGLCLTAVFALVQSLPADNKDRSPQAPPTDPLQHASEVERLQAQLEELRAQIRAAQVRHGQAQRAIASTQERLAHSLEAAHKARHERERLSAEIEQLHEALKRDRQAPKAAQTEQPLAGRATRRDEQKPPRTDSRRPAKPLAAQPDDRSRPHLAEQARHAERPPTAQGFTLRFASREALDRLVSTGSVRFYGMAGKQAWLLSLRQGGPGFAQAAFPGQFHEMAAATVPPPYVEAFAKLARDPGAGSVVWGVQLPPETERQITSLTRDLQGGALVIAADGRVHLDGEDRGE